eukprot:scaffold40010_cov58-Phaeocystis_antarctica.AAC.1
MHTFRHEAHGDVFLDDEVVGGGSGSAGGGAAPGVITNGRGLEPSGYGDAQVLRWGLAPQGGGRVEVQQLGVRLMVRL